MMSSTTKNTDTSELIYEPASADQDTGRASEIVPKKI